MFSAAYCGVHDGRSERLHGHMFTVVLRLSGELDAGDGAGLRCREVRAGYGRRAATAAHAAARSAPWVTVTQAGGQVEAGDGVKR